MGCFAMVILTPTKAKRAVAGVLVVVARLYDVLLWSYWPLSWPFLGS